MPPSSTACTSTISLAGRLTLNSQLMEMPKAIGEFVIVHEMVHMLAPNHGRVFKSFLDAYLPDWRERESLLRKYEIYFEEIRCP